MKQKLFFSLVFSFLFFSSEVHPARRVALSSQVFEVVEFIPHTEAGQWTSYLAMNISFEPIRRLFEKLDARLGGTLNKENARIEAHITVVTPVEFHEVLREKMSIKEVHDIAKKHEIQKSDFKIVCLGRGEAIVEGNKEYTYYLVVTSPQLLEIRKEVFKLLRKRNGNVSQFDPQLFYPHITIGYTSSDLHLEQHGVKKGKNSCYASVALQK